MTDEQKLEVLTSYDPHNEDMRSQYEKRVVYDLLFPKWKWQNFINKVA